MNKVNILEKNSVESENTQAIFSVLKELYSRDSVNREYTKEEKLKAAYALNLCTVSVSQIIDYDDLMILEQEYEMILNNLNLENMPKDEALLNILKQILDTITFFRIQDVEKKMIEKDYQHKMKNALWSAAPNLGFVVAGGSPFTMAVSLATQVGIGYMNYRKCKAENKLEKERQYWKLQRSAIEQLNGLRRELFDTAWRLADEYKFPDEYRLTERQIKQYNEILMDTDLIRKYERLNVIKDKFKAYVPFWYYFANTANQIYQDFTLNEEIRNYYCDLAKKHYEYFIAINDKNLLREDKIVAVCILEYIDLPQISDADRINMLLNKAIDNAGCDWDILQLCAIAYFKNNNVEKAVDILKQLVNEDYNSILNAQILSNIIISEYMLKNNNSLLPHYQLLKRRIDEEYLFPEPSEGVTYEYMNYRFCERQKKILCDKLKLVLNALIKKYTIEYNKLFPNVDNGVQRDDYYYEDNVYSRSRRYDEINKVFNNSRKKEMYLDAFDGDVFTERLFIIINKMYEAFIENIYIDSPELIYSAMRNGININKDQITKLINLAPEKYSSITVEDIFAVPFKNIIYDFVKEVYEQLSCRYRSLDKMIDVIEAEECLRLMCKNHNIKSPDDLFKERCVIESDKEKNHIFSANILGIDYEKDKNDINMKREVNKIVENYKSKIIVNNEKTKLLLPNQVLFNTYFNNLKDKELKQIKGYTIAIVDQSGTGVDLLVTTKGLFAIKNGNFSAMILYRDIEYKDGNISGRCCERNIMEDIKSGAFFVATGLTSIFVAKKVYDKLSKNDDFKYKNKNIVIEELYKMLKEISDEVSRNLTDDIEMKHKDFDQYTFLLDGENVNKNIQLKSEGIYDIKSKEKFILSGVLKEKNNVCILLGQVVNGKFKVGENVNIINDKDEHIISVTVQGIESSGIEKSEIDSSSGIAKLYVELLDSNAIMDAISKGNAYLEKQKVHMSIQEFFS